ncbi:hypothetical protein RSOLAG1IB_07790 [Rhizoctonia solani AG-1 IB]|uniref:Fe2OG dioxygenase domain-containing protein n=1 Tax=Thanatephorus cucumeris (strain AG1-IB / isolate 7/3/14) TaxID=1108050 RepID=A0A0B7FHG9_THACB|nr:hypothetical protein RSOLAG1IB_07790 [Rhizoctonia solani AG-1 IB]
MLRHVLMWRPVLKQSYHPSPSTMPAVDLISLASQTTGSFDSIPVIDISGLSGDTDSKAQVISAIQEACIHVGFFYVKNHGIDEASIASAIDAARRFYGLPMEEKMKLDFHKTTHFRGYYPIVKKKYFHESFELGPEVNRPSVSSLSGPNLWPSEDIIPGFREPVLKYYQDVVELGMKLLTAFALALNLPDEYFVDKVQTSPATMRITHYPPQAEVVDNEGSGLEEHTDFQLFTVLWQDDKAGLQALNPFGQWIDVVPIPGTLVINVADQLSRWTNDIFKSVVHRVINKSGAQRYSMPLFFGLDHDVMLEALPSCVSESRPARYEPILAGDHVRARFEKAYAQPKQLESQFLVR